LGLGLDSGAACTRTGLPLADMSCGLEPVRAAAAAAMAMLPRCPIYRMGGNIYAYAYGGAT